MSIKRITPIPATKFNRSILSWFDKNGRKGLPWQSQKTPYRVWVSEIMLQQTQVATVIDYYQRFMHQFPDVFALANANIEHVLSLWAGLGYYSRAHNLHTTSKKIVDDFHGVFPTALEELIKLPGIGRSTASAIITLALNQPATILDGNVKRVFARFTAIKQDIKQTKTEQLLWEIAEYYSPKTRCADYTQAMMDLGALVCLPKNPLCKLCPLQDWCLAYKNNLQDSIPIKKTKRTLALKHKTFLVLVNDRKILLRKRDNFGIWRGLWSLPELEGPPDNEQLQTLYHQFGFHRHECEELPPFTHTFSHFKLRMYPLLVKIKGNLGYQLQDKCEYWYDPHQAETFGLPKPIATLLKLVTNESNLLQKTAKTSA